MVTTMNNQSVIQEFLKWKRVTNHSKRENISEKTIRQYRNVLESYDKSLGKPFKQATQQDILHHLEGYKTKSQNVIIILLRDFYRWHYDLDDNDPLPDCIRKMKPRTVQMDDLEYAERVITPNEYNLLLEYCDKPMQRALLETLWVTGGRKEEIQTLRVGDVSYDGKFTRIKIRVSKTTSREVIHPARAEHLLKWRETLCPFKDEPDKPLFVSKWGGELKQISIDYAWTMLESVCKKAKLGRTVKPHDFRHSCATRMLKEGVPPTHVQTLLGWSKGSQMIKLYDHNGIADYQDWVNRKQRDTKPTYELLQKQKEELESKHEKQLKILNERLRVSEENITQILESLEPYKQELANIVRNRAIGSAKLVLENAEKH